MKLQDTRFIGFFNWAQHNMAGARHREKFELMAKLTLALAPTPLILMLPTSPKDLRECGTHHDRDINGAKNILAAGEARVSLWSDRKTP